MAGAPPAARYFMQFWAQKHWRDTAQARGDEGAPFKYSASNRFDQRGLRAGDRLYVVGIDGGELLLIGRMDVEHVVKTAQAKRLLGSANLYPGKEWHATARPPMHRLSFQRRVPERVARAIQTEDGRPPAIDPTDYRISGRALVTGRFLAPESAALLDGLIDHERADSDEVRDVEASARGRAFGTQLTRAQRKAIEDCAVRAATKHFEDEGWDVKDVGLYGP